MISLSSFLKQSSASHTPPICHGFHSSIDAAQCRKQHRQLYQQYQKLQPKKQADFYERHRPELAQYERALKLLAPLEESGRKWTLRQLKDAYRQLEKQRFSQEYEMRNMKGTVRRMELVKHAYINDQKKTVRKERVAEEQS